MGQFPLTGTQIVSEEYLQKKATRQRNNLINEDNMPTDCNMNSDTLNEHGLCILRHRRKEESYVKIISVWCELLLSAILCYSQLYLPNKN